MIHDDPTTYAVLAYAMVIAFCCLVVSCIRVVQDWEPRAQVIEEVDPDADPLPPRMRRTRDAFIRSSVSVTRLRDGRRRSATWADVLL